MPPVDTRYFKSPTESISDYQTRVSQFQTPTISTASMSGGGAITPQVTQQQIVTTPPELQLTAPEQQTEAQQQDLLTSTMELNKELAGEGAFTEQAKAEQDIIGKQSAVTSFQNQMRQLQQEAVGVNLQLQQTLQQQQEAARGQGITAGGLAPHQRAAQTTANQAILSNAIRQYSVGAQLYAAQGDLATAMNYVEQAVNLKYQPMRDRLAANMANLELIKSSPDFTSAQQKRAAQMEWSLKMREHDMAKQEQQEKALEEMIIMAVSSGEVPSDIIKKARTLDPIEAADLLGPYMKDPMKELELKEKLLEIDYKNAQIKKIETETRKVENEIAETGSATGTSSDMIAGWQLVNDLLSDPTLSSITGAPAPTAFLPGSKAQYAKNKLKNLQSILSLENRQKLKGSGQISDYESRVLEAAASSLGTQTKVGTWMISDEDMQTELKKIRGVMATASGGMTNVDVVDPSTGEVKNGYMDRAQIESAVRQGYQIEYQ